MLCFETLFPLLLWQFSRSKMGKGKVVLTVSVFSNVFFYIFYRCVEHIFQVKITSNNDEMLRAAVEQFIDKTDKEIQVEKTA
jgi:hypothetical protein